jgi:quercetin dioxygenase-like cupin family protein
MLRAGDQIENARSGQRKTFLVTAEDSGGELLRMEEHNPPGPFEPVHIHPEQVSTAEVLSGSLLFVVGGREIRLGPGSRLEIPPGTPHTFRNEGPQEAHWIGEFRPALRIAEFFETLFTLARRGELNAGGMPSPLQLALSVPAFGREIRLASPPWLVQRLALAPLAPLARLRGLQPAYGWSPPEPAAAVVPNYERDVP